MRRLRFVIAAILLLAALHPAGATAAPPILLQARYECLWWSPDQFRNFDPNNPPDKRTVTILTKWEYSDPVSVPHPDVVTLVATVASGVTAPSLRIRWLTRTGWVDPKPPAPNPARDGSGEPASYRFQIPVETAVARYHPRRLRAILFAGRRRLGQADLPFQLGD